MREIKFRFWNTRTGEFEEDSDLFFVRGDGVICSNDSVENNLEAEQYTGLKDKNGKEIYEGDIIHRGRLPKVNVFRNSVIRFDKESVGFIATSTRKGARTIFNGWTCDEIEVIGNIHENQELLERKDAKN